MVAGFIYQDRSSNGPIHMTECNQGLISRTRGQGGHQGFRNQGQRGEVTRTWDTGDSGDSGDSGDTWDTVERDARKGTRDTGKG